MPLIRVVNETRPSDDLILVEFQGSFERGEASKDFSGMTIGELSIDEASDTAVLLMPRQRLTGKRIALKKPIAVLEQQQNTTSSGGTETIKIVKLLEHKFLFDKRPVTVFSTNR